MATELPDTIKLPDDWGELHPAARREVLDLPERKAELIKNYQESGIAKTSKRWGLDPGAIYSTLKRWGIEKSGYSQRAKENAQSHEGKPGQTISHKKKSQEGRPEPRPSIVIEHHPLMVEFLKALPKIGQMLSEKEIIKHTECFSGICRVVYTNKENAV